MIINEFFFLVVPVNRFIVSLWHVVGCVICDTDNIPDTGEKHSVGGTRIDEHERWDQALSGLVGYPTCN